MAAGGGLLVLAALCGCGREESGPAASLLPGGTLVWTLEDTRSVAGYKTRVLGSPRAIETPLGPAVLFDGRDDGLVVPTHPLAGAAEFTAEVVFRPDEGGAAEQRFLHLQEGGSQDRILFETRLTPDGQWFLDTYVKTGDRGHSLYAKRRLHPLGEWHHAALVVGGGQMKHYVNGRLESTRPIRYRPQGPGRTSVGVRINQVSWFKGAVREARFTPRVLSPGEFSLPPEGG